MRQEQTRGVSFRETVLPYSMCHLSEFDVFSSVIHFCIYLHFVLRFFGGKGHFCRNTRPFDSVISSLFKMIDSSRNLLIIFMDDLKLDDL